MFPYFHYTAIVRNTAITPTANESLSVNLNQAIINHSICHISRINY